MAVIKCKMCGGNLDIEEGMTVAECEYCGTKQTVPNIDDEKKIKLFERANRLRKACEFDKASGVFESIIADFDTESEAYWGLILCKYGIEYVDDPATKKKVPTCHRSSFDSVMKDENLELALENADLIAQRIYREEAKRIEELRHGIIEVSAKEEPYDIFISYKELDENGERTVDSVIAQDIYKELTSMGYRVFFSRISLESKLGTEYEPYIFAALNSAKVMLVVGTSYENFNAVWVKNEWSRFLALIARGEKKTLIPVFKDIDAYDMPEEFAKLSAQNIAKIGAMQDLSHGIEKLVPLKKEEAPAIAATAQQVSSPNVDTLLKRGMMFLEDRDWESADDYFNKVLDIAPENGEAYYGKLMVELKATRISEIGAGNYILSAKAYKRFEQFGTNERKAELEPRIREETERVRVEAENRDRKSNELAAARPTAEKFGKLIHAGANYTIGIKPDGTVISTGATAKHWSGIVALSSDGSNIVGLKSNGTVVTNRWMANLLYLGQGDEVKDWTDIVAIAAGQHGDCRHIVGLKPDGTVVSAGDNSVGQRNVSGWTDIVTISTADIHTVGLRSDGTVVASGSNKYGACNVSSWTDIVAISAGTFHTIGLKYDGTVVAAGCGCSGNCNVSDWTDIVAISTDSSHTVGLKSDGTVVAVGSNSSGECDVSEWTDIVAISAGNSHTVGLKSDGTVVAVGTKENGKRNVGGWKLFDSVDTYDEEVAEKTQNRITALFEEKKKLAEELPGLHGVLKAGRRKEVEARISEINKELENYK